MSRIADTQELTAEIAATAVNGVSNLGYCQVHQQPQAVVVSRGNRLTGFATLGEAVAFILRCWW